MVDGFFLLSSQHNTTDRSEQFKGPTKKPIDSTPASSKNCFLVVFIKASRRPKKKNVGVSRWIVGGSFVVKDLICRHVRSYIELNTPKTKHTVKWISRSDFMKSSRLEKSTIYKNRKML